MKLTAIQAVSGVEALSRINRTELSLSLALALMNNQKVLMEVAKEFNERRQKLLTKYGTPHESKPDMFKIDDDKVKEFNDLVVAMESEELNLKITQVKHSAFGSNFKISPNDLHSLEWMLKDDNSETPKKT